MGKTLPYNNLGAVRARMAVMAPVLDNIDMVETADWTAFRTAGPMGDAPFTSPISNFYMTDPISRASATMAACTTTFVNGATEKTCTDG